MTTEITGKKRRNDQQLYSQGHMLQSPLAPRYTPQFDLISNILHDGIETRLSSLKNTSIQPFLCFHIHHATETTNELKPLR